MLQASRGDKGKKYIYRLPMQCYLEPKQFKRKKERKKKEQEGGVLRGPA